MPPLTPPSTLAAIPQKISYMNRWDAKRTYTLSTSDDGKMRARYTRLDVAPRGTAYIKLWFAAASEPGMEEHFCFINDADGQSEECLLLRTRYS